MARGWTYNPDRKCIHLGGNVPPVFLRQVHELIITGRWPSVRKLIFIALDEFYHNHIDDHGDVNIKQTKPEGFHDGKVVSKEEREAVSSVSRETGKVSDKGNS